MLGRLRKGHCHSACNLITLCVCILLWAARGCAALYFYAYDYSSWVSTVMVFRNTSIMRDTGWLQMNAYANATVGRALYKTAFQMKNSTNGSVSSFNTSFVFSMNTSRGREYYGDGLAFLICPNPFRGDDLQVSSGGYLGMFNSATNGLLKNRIFAIEFDTHRNAAFRDPNDNHIGVDINSVVSLKTNNLSTLGIILNEGKKMVCWVDYDGGQRYLRVYLALSPAGKPLSPAIAMALDLAPYMKDNMYVGFTSSTGTRAELHTIFSWWFLAGFGNLTLPGSPSPPSSHRPLASLGQRSIVIAIFSLAVVISFFGFFCIYARQRWQKQSKHLIDILLPVACWMYWKESITCEVHSTRCLKLATPTVELLAWLWRTRLARKHDSPRVTTWPAKLKRKMGPHHRGEAWQMEDKRWKRHKRHGAVRVIVHEEANNKESSSDEDEMRERVIRHAIMRPEPERKMEEAEAAKMKEEPVVVLSPPVKQQRESKLVRKDRPPMHTEGLARSILRAGAEGKVKVPKSYIIESESFVAVEDQSDARLFQRRGSFLIPQGAPDGQELPLEPAKEVHAAFPVVATPLAWSQPEESVGPSKVKIAKGRMRLQPKTVYISTTDDPTGNKFYMRRGSFCVHPEDAINVVGVQGAEGDVKEPLRQYLVEEAVDDIKIERGADERRASFSVDPEAAITLTESRSTGGKEPSTLYSVENGTTSTSKRRINIRRGSFIVVEGAESSSKPGTSDQTMEVVDNTSHDHAIGARVATDQSLKSPPTFTVDPEAAITLTGSQSTGEREPSMQYAVERGITSTSKRRINIRRGSFIVVKDAESSSKPGTNHQTMEIVDNTTSDHVGAEVATDQSPKSPPPSSSSADDGGRSHVTHRWLFD